jgi:hypothetical protein
MTGESRFSMKLMENYEIRQRGSIIRRNFDMKISYQL